MSRELRVRMLLVSMLSIVVLTVAMVMPVAAQEEGPPRGRLMRMGSRSTIG